MSIYLLIIPDLNPSFFEHCKNNIKVEYLLSDKLVIIAV